LNSTVYATEGIYTEITATEAAAHCDVSVSAIAKWVARGHLTPCGVDDRGRKLYRLIDVAKAEYATRKKARR
jgi:hypothetical protein